MNVISYIKKYPVTPYFYNIPKIHKDEKNPTGRPIIAGMESLTSNLGCYIDHFLQAIVQNFPSYSKDSGHMLEILSNYTWQKQYRWLSLDVTSLYTSIKHEFGLAAIQYFLCKDQLFHHQQIWFLYASIEFALTHNNFSCLGKHYRQMQGTAMGARFPPNYANLFLGYWEQFNI